MLQVFHSVLSKPWNVVTQNLIDFPAKLLSEAKNSINARDSEYLITHEIIHCEIQSQRVIGVFFLTKTKQKLFNYTAFETNL